MKNDPVKNIYSFLKYFIIFTMLFSAIFITFSVSACENKEKVIKIGSQAVFSGDDLFYGQDQAISMEIAISELSPVRIGGFDYRINLVAKDDEGNAEKAFLIAQEFVEENVAAVIGSTFNGTTKASLTVYSEYNVPMLAPCSQAVEVQSASDIFYRMIINNSQKIENIASFLTESIKPEKLLLIDNGEEYSVKLTDHLIEIFNSRNISFAKRYSVKFDPEQYSVLAENILIDEPDYVFFSANYNEVAQLITKVRELGLSCGFITEEPGMDKGISVLTNKEYLEGLIAIVPEPPSLAKYSEDKRAIEFWRKYNDYLNRSDEDEIVLTGPGQYAPYSYDSVYVLIDAMKRANSILPEDFKDKLKSTSLDGVSGRIEFNSNGERLNPLSTVFIIKNGDWVRYSN